MDYFSLREKQGEVCLRDACDSARISHGPMLTGLRNKIEGDLPILDDTVIIELKTGPLDPENYRQHMVSVLKVKPWQKDDFELDLAAESLRLTRKELTRGTPLTPETNMRFALLPAVNDAWYWFVDPDPPVARIYMVDGHDLLEQVRERIGTQGLTNRMGNAKPTGMIWGVYIDNPTTWWERREDGVWRVATA